MTAVIVAFDNVHLTLLNEIDLFNYLQFQITATNLALRTTLFPLQTGKLRVTRTT